MGIDVDDVPTTVFSGEAEDRLIGNKNNDHLYGGAGNDTLDGGEGNDYLEGGEGADDYRFNYGDGRDVIVESGSGNNRIFLQHSADDPEPVAIGELSLVADSDILMYVELDEDGKPKNNTTYTVLHTPTDDDPDHESLLITIDCGAGGSITIEDWQGNDNRFGLELGDVPTPNEPETTRTHINTTTDGLRIDDDGESVIDIWNGYPPEDADQQRDINASERLVGGHYIDHIYGRRGDDDIDTGNSTRPAGYQDREEFSDIAAGGLGNDRLVGGEGRQTLWGGNGGFLFVPEDERLSQIVSVNGEYIYQTVTTSGFSDNDYLALLPRVLRSAALVHPARHGGAGEIVR